MSDLGFLFDSTTTAKLGEITVFMLMVTLCAAVLSWTYRKISRHEDDDLEFGWTIFILTISIGLLVSIIKHAPAVSFGLFGAMSLMRFRAQIKRPARMVFIFMAATVGVCCGAGEYLTTAIGTILLSGLALLSYGQLYRVTGAAAGEGVDEKDTRKVAKKAAKGTDGAADGGSIWGIDFARFTLADGTRARVLVVTDEANGAVLSALADAGITGWRVAAELERLAAVGGKPATIVGDSWPDFSSNPFEVWLRSAGAKWRFVDPGARPEPRVFGVVRRLQDRLDGVPRLASIADAEAVVAAWQVAEVDVATAERPMMSPSLVVGKFPVAARPAEREAGGGVAAGVAGITSSAKV